MVKSIRPTLANATEYLRFKGTYYLIGCVAKNSANGDIIWVVHVSDSSGTMKIYCRDLSCMIGELQPNTMVHIEAQLDQRHAKAYWCCKYIEQCTNPTLEGHQLSSLPIGLCPKPESLLALLTIINNINCELLAQFVKTVIMQSSVAICYITCPGSLNYHHNYAGGLLEHSVEVASRLASDKRLPKAQRDIAIVAALLHDIGKTQTLTADGTRTAVGYLVDHDALTLELCASAMQKLELQNSHLANQLRHAWTCATPNSRYGFQPKTTLARKLQQYDRHSASM